VKIKQNTLVKLKGNYIMRKSVNWVILFGLKVFIILYVLSYFIPSTDQLLKNYRVKYFMISLIDNPNILYELSRRDEENKKYKSSIRYINSAIGILEKNNAPKEIMKKYTTELDRLRKISVNQ
jgi:hypothetical protein